MSFDDFEDTTSPLFLQRRANLKRVLRLQYEILLAIKRLKELPKP